MSSQENIITKSLLAIKKVKIIELVLIILVEIAYFCVVFFNEVLRNAVFTNKLLLTLCILMWIALLISFIFILIDLSMLKKLTN